MTKFLGVYVDEHLTWKHHISFICKQIFKSVGIISRSRFYLSSKTKLTLYYALIYPCITYCNSTWSSTYVTNLNRIFCLQKRVVRVITNSDYRGHSAPLFTKLGILDVFPVNSFQIAKFMFYYHNLLLPPMFLNLFLTSGQVHNYMAPERLAAIDRILVAQILSNLQSFTKVPKSGTPSLYHLLHHPVFSPLRQKCWSFYLKNQNLELAMPSLRSSLFFLLLTITEVASLISLVVS